MKMVSHFIHENESEFKKFCYCITLDADEVRLIEGKKINILQIDGKTIFSLRSNGKDLGQKVIYITFE